MQKIHTTLVATLAAITLALTTATVIQAADYSCTGAVGAQRYENLAVPAGASCTLTGTRVDGNIVVGRNATLLAKNVSVGGNVQADGATSVTVNNDATVGGSIQLKQGGGATVDRVRVTGDVQLESNRSALSVTFSRVGGNVQVTQNRGGATISDNRINGNLECKENIPAPTGGRNQAASFKDQCAGFAGVPATPPPVTPAPTPTVTPTPVPGGDGVCRGSLGAQRYENLAVPAGASCTLNGTQVDGNITVGRGATLHAIEVAVGGDIQADGAADVTVNNNAVVRGNIQIKQGASATIDRVRVTGDIQLEENRSALSVTFNRVEGNVQIFKNRGGATIGDNRIDGNLQCKENAPAPVGARNQAASYEEQCAGFAGTPAPLLALAAAPDSVTCQGSIGAGSFASLSVPAGGSCSLLGTRISGDVTVGAGATLLGSGLTVGGDIQAQGAAVVTVNNTTVGGSISLRQGGSVMVDQVQVRGALHVTSNQQASSAVRNQVGDSLQVIGNQASVVVRGNAVDGALRCQANQLAPLVIANQAGSLEEQCAGFNVRVYLPAIALRR